SSDTSPSTSCATPAKTSSRRDPDCAERRPTPPPPETPPSNGEEKSPDGTQTISPRSCKAPPLTRILSPAGPLASDRVHSRYRRTLGDLPIGGRAVRLLLNARRFRCVVDRCRRRIFAERSEAAKPWARRTARLDALAHHLALALGGRPAESFAKRLQLPLSRDTLLRLVRRSGAPKFEPPCAVGIDDWAWRRNYRYGTLICDLERRRTISLLPDREPATAQAWLAAQPQIEVVTRDRGGAYALAAARALPSALQVADRWHLMANASQAFLAATRGSMRTIRAALGAPTIDPQLLTSAEKLQYEGYLRREEINGAILELAKAGTPIREIVRRTGHSRGLVRKVLRGQRSEVFQSRESSIDSFLPWLDAQWESGVRNGAALHRDLKAHGFAGSLRVVTEWATRRRRADTANLERLSRTPSARTISRLLTLERDQLTRAQTLTVAAIEQAAPALIEARELMAAFHVLIRQKKV
ncbi:MAG: ISL3 family transposase, partial [Caulobacteraceae bacterium]|nr:ISL3 family transposase [Caulobacteraceae bacterium]